MRADKAAQTSHCRRLTESATVPDYSDHGVVGGMLRPASPANSAVGKHVSFAGSSSITIEECCRRPTSRACLWIWMNLRRTEDIHSSRMTVLVSPGCSGWCSRVWAGGTICSWAKTWWTSSPEVSLLFLKPVGELSRCLLVDWIW